MFGEVTEGFEVLRELNEIGSADGNPTEKAVIEDSGEIKLEKIPKQSKVKYIETPNIIMKSLKLNK